MRRRQLLGGIAAGSIGITGYLSDGEPLRGESDSARPTEIIGYDFETDVETDVEMKDGPEITVKRSDSTVAVEGIGAYGSSACGYLDAQKPEYDPESAELSVDVRAVQDRSDGDRYCEDDVSASSYRFVIRFDGGVPARIEAKHPFERTSTKEPR